MGGVSGHRCSCLLCANPAYSRLLRTCGRRTRAPLCCCRQVIDSTTIDRVNILQAALQAMREAALQLPRGSFDFLLVDGNKVPEQLPVPAEAVVKGDGTCSCIAAASIIAKVGFPQFSPGTLLPDYLRSKFANAHCVL